MAQTQLSYQTEDVLRAIEALSTWSNESVRCVSCREISQRHTCTTPKGKLCVACAFDEFKKAIEKENVQKYTSNQILEALQAEGRLRVRMLILWKPVEAFQMFYVNFPGLYPKFLQLVVSNLGYDSLHPFAPFIRQTTHHICVQLGKSVLGTILAHWQKSPWFYYANLVLTAGLIAPHNQQVHKLLDEAAVDAHAGIRKNVLLAIEKNESPWAWETALMLAEDHDLGVRNYAKKIINNWKSRKKTAPAQPEPGETPREVPPIVFDKLEEMIDRYYTAAVLKIIFKEYLLQFSADLNFEVSEKNSIHKLKKAELVRMLADVYRNKKLFLRLYHSLRPDVKQAFDILLWEGQTVSGGQLQKRVGQQIINPNATTRRIEQNIDAHFLILPVESQEFYFITNRMYLQNFVFYFDGVFRNLFRKHLPIPKDGELSGLEKINKTDFSYENQNEIIEKLPLYLSYIDQGNLKLTRSGETVLKTSLRKMTQYCQIKEFFDTQEKELEGLRTWMIIAMLLKFNKRPFSAQPEFIKNFFEAFFGGSDFKQFQLRKLLTHLKGFYSDYYYNDLNEPASRRSLKKILKNMPLGKWVAFSNIERYCYYNQLHFDIIDRNTARQSIYFNKKSSEKHIEHIKTNISDDIYKDTIIIPALKAAMFLAASFGLVDIAYDYPRNDVLQVKNQDYLSVFDGLKYVRLTPLGAFVVEQTEHFEYTIQKEPLKIILDENHLLINVEGDDLIKRMIIEKIAERINVSCYRVNYKSFLKECSSSEDIQNRVKLFKNEIAANPPRIWQAFLDEVLAKLNPLTEREALRAYQINPNPELMSLLTTDEVLKKHVLKAENYHLLISQKDLNKVKKRLEEFGYFIDKI